METNYELKHKCLLVPLKAVLLVLAMILVGFPTFAQSGKSVRVANNEQLIEAMQNPAIGTVELQAGYYPYLNYQAVEGTKVFKSKPDNGNREALCTYYIIGNKVCFITDDQGYSSLEIAAGYVDANVPPCNCCPSGPNQGHWSVHGQPTGSNYYFASNDDTQQITDFFADMPGEYILRYTWPATSSHVETPYYFYGPVTVDLQADDVCGLTTPVTFTLSSAFPDPVTVVSWTLDGNPYPAGPSASSTFDLTVAQCGLHTLAVTVDPEQCDPVYEYIVIDFSCMPTADAGPDMYTCGDLCLDLVGSTGLTFFSPSYAYSWYQVSGPGTLTFNPDPNELSVQACIDANPPCEYGKYHVEFQVQNGQCYDEDDAWLRYYQQPTANAGADQHLCNDFTFDLAAVPFDYCGTAGVNYWSTTGWELVSYPAGANVSFDASDPNAAVSVTGTGCLYGEYTFKWKEKNSEGPNLGECTAEDLVTVYIYETPAPDAGEDMVFCDTFAFSLWGTGDAPCYQNTVVKYSWEKTAQPGDCLIEFSDLNVLSPAVTISECGTSCPYGEYIFTLTQENGYYDDNDVFHGVCEGSDDVSYWVFQPVVADAGGDQHICDTWAFTMTAVPTTLCGTSGVNYFEHGVWEFVEGPSTCVTIADVNNPHSGVTIDKTCAPCPYGVYTFKWTEYNGFGTPFQGCSDVDFVSIYVDEVPESVNAGLDQVFCNDFEFALDGTIDLPCIQTTAYSYKWEVIAQPDPTCTVSIQPNAEDPGVSITNCGGCPYGEYVFRFTQMNGYYDGDVFHTVCSDYDEVSVWIFEPIDANAGQDQHLCNDFTFDLTATPTAFCGTAGVNYFRDGEWSQTGGPAPADITPGNYGEASVVVDPSGITCPYGAYTFRWTEKNGFFGIGSTLYGFCEGWDEVTIFIYPEPKVSAGNDQEYCDVRSFQLDGTVDEPCTDLTTRIYWEYISGPSCDVSFMYDNMIDPYVNINCESGCLYGEYTFKVTQENGYWDGDFWVAVCWASDEVSVKIYEPPTNVNAGPDQKLCDDFSFDLTASGSDYCSTPTNWYSWTVISQPDPTCTITLGAPTALTTSVEITGCAGECPYGEYVFRFTEFNGSANVFCSDDDEVTVTIFEKPDADAGEDVNECISATDFPYCTDMTGSLEYCYSMVGIWSKSCGPGLVQFEELDNPTTQVCFDQPGRYKFTWTAWNGATNCIDADEVIFDLLEQPTASTEAARVYAPCDALCVDIQANKYNYIGTDEGECPNFQDFAHWSVVSGPGNVTFAPDDTHANAEMCVDAYGGYTVRWNEVNKAVDGLTECSDFVDVYVEFNKTPEPEAIGGDTCGNCFQLTGILDGGFNPSYYWEFVSGSCDVTFDPDALNPLVCIPDYHECYGDYVFVLHQFNGECEGTATATVTFKEMPHPVGICFNNNANNCPSSNQNNQPDFDYNGCLQPGDVLYTCADGDSYFSLGPWCNCEPGFDWYNPAYYGWTFEWSVIAPAGTEVWSQPGYYDYEDGSWVYPTLDIHWGECCDTARIYLTITPPNNCPLTLEYKAFVYHKPCINIVDLSADHPWEAEVGMVSQYCNNCPPNPCLLYTWTAEHCGIIQDGQGTPCIDVLWTNYNVHGGIGEITLTVFDTCTGCCNYEAKDIKIYPTGTLGDATLAGHVYYHNNSETPLNGVDITLWNGNVPVMTTQSYVKFVDGTPPVSIPGYYEFAHLNGTTNFGITASYSAPWYGANATDALAVELKTINNLPGSFIYDDVVESAMNVNNSVTPLISAVDALWIKQRAINMVNYFPAGNWAFDKSMTTQAVADFDVLALSMGDANRSNIPNSNKSMPAIDLVNDGMINVVNGQVFDLPIRIAKADQFGAITLNLEFNPSLIKVIDVNASEGMLSNITENNVGIAWSNLNPMVLADNDVVVVLKVKAIGLIPSTESVFRVGLNSEFADPTANVIEPVTLKTFGITTDPAALDYFLSSNRPNPFSTSTTIEYTMPESGKVKLSVLDMLGQEIAVLVDATQTAGSYSVEFNAAGLATGVYLYKITVDGETRDFISTQRMVVSH
jgi:hypothetical protein